MLRFLTFDRSIWIYYTIIHPVWYILTMYWTWWLYWIYLVTIVYFFIALLHFLDYVSIWVSHLSELWIRHTSLDMLIDRVRSIIDNWTLIPHSHITNIVFFSELYTSEFFTLAPESYWVLCVEFTELIRSFFWLHYNFSIRLIFDFSTLWKKINKLLFYFVGLRHEWDGWFIFYFLYFSL